MLAGAAFASGASLPQTLTRCPEGRAAPHVWPLKRHQPVDRSFSGALGSKKKTQELENACALSEVALWLIYLVLSVGQFCMRREFVLISARTWD